MMARDLSTLNQYRHTPTEMKPQIRRLACHDREAEPREMPLQDLLGQQYRGHQKIIAYVVAKLAIEI